jgi:hypothetical protein
MSEITPIMWAAIEYFVVGMFLALAIIDIAIVAALATKHVRLAVRLQRLLDKFAWPLRMGGGC